MPGARSRRDGRRLGLRVRARRSQRAARSRGSCAASRTGTCATRWRRCRASPRSRRSAAACGSTRSSSTRCGSRRSASRSAQVIDAVRASNEDSGGRVLELAGHEYVVRGRGYVTSARRPAQDRAARRRRRAVTVGDVGVVTLGPDMRRGVAELDGEGEVVGGIVVMRYGAERARRDRRREGAPRGAAGRRCPPGVEIVPTYDRSELIRDADRDAAARAARRAGDRRRS